jgi:hypothetical protein
MWTIPAWLGRLAWPALRWLAPGLPPQLTAALGVLLLALITIGGPALAVYIHMRGAITAAELRRDMHWKDEIARANADHQTRLEAALAAADDEPATPVDRAERLRACQQSPSCRDRRRQ